jgi:hypothetical protein
MTENKTPGFDAFMAKARKDAEAVVKPATHTAEAPKDGAIQRIRELTKEVTQDVYTGLGGGKPAATGTALVGDHRHLQGQGRQVEKLENAVRGADSRGATSGAGFPGQEGLATVAGIAAGGVVAIGGTIVEAAKGLGSMAGIKGLELPKAVTGQTTMTLDGEINHGLKVAQEKVKKVVDGAANNPDLYKKPGGFVKQ